MAAGEERKKRTASGLPVNQTKEERNSSVHWEDGPFCHRGFPRDRQETSEVPREGGSVGQGEGARARLALCPADERDPKKIADPRMVVKMVSINESCPKARPFTRASAREKGMDYFPHRGTRPPRKRGCEPLGSSCWPAGRVNALGAENPGSGRKKHEDSVGPLLPQPNGGLSERRRGEGG